MSDLNMPEPIPVVACQCMGPAVAMSGCICGETERALRAGVTLTTAQREWCIDQVTSVEGHTRNECDGLTDAEIGRAVISAWIDYCRDVGVMS